MSRFKVLSLILVVVVVFAGSWWGTSAKAIPPQVVLSKQFTLFMYETPQEFAVRTDTGEKGAAYWKSWGDYRVQLETAGVLRGGMPLQLSEHSKQVHIQNGQVVTTDGAFAPSDPQMTGYFMIEVDNLETAQAWAAKAPNASTSLVVVSPAYPMAMPAVTK